jgi:hypothetical protein
MTPLPVDDGVELKFLETSRRPGGIPMTIPHTRWGAIEISRRSIPDRGHTALNPCISRGRIEMRYSGRECSIRKSARPNAGGVELKRHNARDSV